MAHRGRTGTPGRIRTAGAFGGLTVINALLTVTAWQAGAVAVGAGRGVDGDPETVLIATLATAGVLALLAVSLDITRQCQVIARAHRRPPAAASATWRMRIAAALIGVGVASPGPASAAGPHLAQTVITAPAQPGAGAAGQLPESPAVAPDPRWGSDAESSGTAPTGLESGGAESSDGSPLIRLTRAGTGTGPEEVVVRRGECLWDIVARRLGPSASAAQIDAEWPRWYAANRARIGADPDLIRPGLRLVVPSDVA